MGHAHDAIFRVIVKGYIHGQEWNNVFWFRTKEGTPSQTLIEDTDALVSDFDLLMLPSYQGMMSVEASIFSITATCLEPKHSAQSIKFYSTKAGTIAGDSLPSYCAGVISWYTQYNGKRLHGRTYVTGIPESDASQSLFNVTHQTRINTFAAALFNRFHDTGASTRFRMVVYSRKNGVTRSMVPPHELNYSPLAGVPVYRYTISRTVATQRHRMLAKGI